MSGFQSFTVKSKLPTLNEYTNSNRTNRFVGSKMKKEATNLVASLAVKQRLKHVDSAIFTFHWYRSSKRSDPDNVAFAIKFILDGLVVAGVLDNDGPKQVLSIAHYFIYDVDEDHVTVEIEEII